MQISTQVKRRRQQWIGNEGDTGRHREEQKRKNYLGLGPRLRLPKSMRRTETINALLPYFPHDDDDNTLSGCYFPQG